MRPVIGIGARPRLIKASGGELWADTVAQTYRNAVTKAGGIPVILAAVDEAAVPQLLDRVDGLLLKGGGDVDPATYGGSAHAEVREFSLERDGFEIALASEAHRRRIPTLAICRGIQILNVALGGSLIEDIPSEVGSTDHDSYGEKSWKAHQHVTIDEGCGLAALVGATHIHVNSIHHQALRRVADGLHPVAWADDGIIEAIEADDERWRLIGVQWHPEYLSAVGDETSDRIFTAFVENAAAAHVVS